MGNVIGGKKDHPADQPLDVVVAENERNDDQQLDAVDGSMQPAAIMDELTEHENDSKNADIDCNCCRKEMGLAPYKHGWRGTCKKHLKNVPSYYRKHAAGLVPDCNCMNCPKRYSRTTFSYTGGLAPF